MVLRQGEFFILQLYTLAREASVGGVSRHLVSLVSLYFPGLNQCAYNIAGSKVYEQYNTVGSTASALGGCPWNTEIIIRRFVNRQRSKATIHTGERIRHPPAR